MTQRKRARIRKGREPEVAPQHLGRLEVAKHVLVGAAVSTSVLDAVQQHRYPADATFGESNLIFGCRAGTPP
jgi:hypothetical protein